MTACKLEQQGDEWFCQTCTLRWAFDDDRPPCPGEKTELRIAKCIIGPRLDKWIGREKLLEVREHKWSEMTTKQDRDDALNAARAIMQELGLE